MSAGMLLSRALSSARRRLALPAGSGPPAFAAIVISRPSLVNSAPRLASTTAFWRLICFHLECPAIDGLLLSCWVGYSTRSLANALALPESDVVDKARPADTHRQ